MCTEGWKRDNCEQSQRRRRRRRKNTHPEDERPEVKQNKRADAPTFTCGRKDEGITVDICTLVHNAGSVSNMPRQ